MVTPTLQLPGYRVRGVIGRGGFGVVHSAVREVDGRPVAIKVLHRVLDDVEGARFAAEIQAMGTLAWHPAIVGILDAGEVEGQPYFVMEHVAGGSLGDRLRDQGAQSPDAVTAAGIQAAMGLQVAHNAGLLHRDIKPDNVLVTADGTVKVSDFGVTLAAGSAGTRRGTTGTVAFAAPELLAGSGATTATDIYALGASLFALLDGEPAYHRETDESPAAMILRAHRDPVPDLAEAGHPAPLATAIQRAMVKDPSQRPARAEDFARELAAAREALGLPAVPVVGAGRAAPGPMPAAAAAVGLPDQPPVEARRKAQRLQRILGGVGAAAAALIAVTFVATSFIGGGSLDGDVGEVNDAAEEVVDAAPDGGDEPEAFEPEDLPAPPAPEPAPPAAEPAPPVPLPSNAPDPTSDPDTSEDLLMGVHRFDDPVVVVTGQYPQLVVGTSTELVVTDVESRDRATLQLSGITDVALVDDVALVTLAEGPPVIVRPVTLDGVASATVTAIDAPELAGAAGGAVESALGRFWVATPESVVAVDAAGSVVASVAVPGVTFVEAAAVAHGQRPVVWLADGQGIVVAVDADTGSPVARFTLGAVRALAVGADSEALAVLADGSIVALSADGSATRRDVAGVLDVAEAMVGPSIVLTDEGVGVLTDDDVITIGIAEPFASLAQVGGEVYAVGDDRSFVRVLR